ncbi:MAG: UDP-3-O-(3-hydroxymyristoyl)glucosamine N-acyltransferase [Hyphomicrobiaceae bacterium]
MHPGFFEIAGPFSLAQIADHVGADLQSDDNGARMFSGVRSLRLASANDIAFFDNRRYAGQLQETSAGACILAERDAGLAPAAVETLIAAKPYDAFAGAMRLFYADALRSKAGTDRMRACGQIVDPSAQIEDGAVIEAGAIVGPEACVGAGTIVAAGSVVGYRSVLGRDCYVGAGAAVTHAIVGDRVIIHAGVQVGQDGFGFAMGPTGHAKVPQIGCVRIADDVEIGANTTIDRGTIGDTVIGAGTKIDNLVQIGHNVVIGMHCVIVAQSGIAGSAELGDYVVMGAQSGILGHVKVGDGAQIAGLAHVKNDVEAGARMGGSPARPFREWARELAAIRNLGRRRG